MSQDVAITGRLEYLPVDKVIPTPDNPRRIDPKDPVLKELSESIKGTGGVVNAVLVRPHPTKPGFFDLRAGERRLIASRMAGLPTIKAEVREMTDPEARMVTAVENLQRQDLTPMEEAQNIKLLLDNSQEHEGIAAQLGRPIGWVHRRARLLSLIPEWIEAFGGKRFKVKGIVHTGKPTPGPFAEWNAGHMELICRYEPDVQKDILTDLCQKGRWINDWTVANLREFLGEKFLQIAKAPWSPKDDALVPEAGACVNCPKRSSCVPHLFDDQAEGNAVAASDTCLDYKCWEKKRLRFLELRRDELKAKHPNLIYIHDDRLDDKSPEKKLFPDTVSDYSVNRAKMSDRGAAPALVVNGPGAGTLRWVRAADWARDAKKQIGKAAAGKGKDGKPKRDMKELRQRLQGRRDAHTILALIALIEKMKDADGLDTTAGSDDNAIEHTLFRLLACFGTDQKYDSSYTSSPWSKFETLRTKGSHQDLLDTAWKQVRPVLVGRLRFSDTAGATRNMDEAKNLAELLSIDLKALQSNAVAEIPEPKSWGHEVPEKKKSAKTKVDAGKLFPAVDQKTVDSLKLALKCHGDGKDRWALRSRTPMTNEQLKTVICNEFGIGGGGGHKDIGLHGYRGGKNPAFWMVADESAKIKKRTFAGKMLIALVRHIFKIPYPEDIKKTDKSKKGTCRICGCTESNACVTNGTPCHWTDESETLCSACAGKQKKSAKKKAKKA